MTDIEAECIRRIADAKGIPAEQISVDSSLESLAVDSLDRVSLAFDLEEQYDVQIPESRLHTIRTVGDVANTVREAFLAKAASASGSNAGAA